MSHWPISILSTLSSFVSMALPLILVRTLDAATLGSFKIFFLYLMVLPPLTMISGVSSGLSYWAGRGDEGRKAIRISGILFLGIASATLIFLYAFQAPISFHLHLRPEWIGLFAVSLFLGIAALFYDDAAIATGRIWGGAIFNAGFELLRTLAIVVTAILTRDLFAIIKAHILVQAMKVVTGYTLAYRQDLFRWEWDPSIVRKVCRYAFPVSLGFIFGMSLNYSDQIILSKGISAAEFALYSLCCLTVPPLLVLEASVTRVLIPQLSQAFSDGRTEEAAQLYRKAVREIAFLVIPAVTGLMVFATPVIELLFTKAYVSGAPYLRMYALWYLTLLIPPDAVARAHGNAKWILGNFAFFTVLTLGLCFFGARSYGAMGALSGLLVARFISRAYTLAWMRKTQQWSIREFVPMRTLTQMAVYCVILAMGALAARPAFSSSLKWFAVMGPLFTIAYFALLFRSKSRAPLQPGKVMMVTPGLLIGGLERMILNLSRSLKQSSAWKPQVLAYDFAPATPAPQNLIASFQSSEIPVWAQGKPPRFSLRTVREMAKWARHEEVSVIHTHDLGALIYGVFTKFFLLARIRLVHTQHSFVHLNRAWKYRYYEKFFSRFADAIAVVSPDTRKSYVELGVSPKKLHLIPNGVEFPSESLSCPEARFRRRSRLIFESRELEEQLGPKIRDFWIVYLARIHGRKGQDHALKLWNELDASDRSRATLIFVGPETENGALRSLERSIAEAHDRDRIVLAGASQNPQEWLRSADLFLSCSEFEGMPLAPVEAIGSGVPALLSKIAGHEFLSRYAVLYDGSDPAEGARKLESILEQHASDPKAFRDRCWNRAEGLRESFTLVSMSKQYEKLYEGIR